MMHPIRALLAVIALMWLTACGGSDSSTPQSTTNQSPPTAQEPTKPPPTTQPPNMAPPSTQPPGSTPPGSGSGGTFTQGTGFNSHVRTIAMADDGTHDLYVGGDFTTYNGTTANHLIRLRPNGTSAQTFGQGFNEVVLALALATDGSHALYAGGGFTQFNGQPANQMVRLSADGLRDVTFQPGTFGQDSFSPFNLAVPEDGSRDVYAAGPVFRPSPPLGNNGTVVRLNTDGTPDSTYSPGTFYIGGDPTEFAIATIAVAPGSGKLYVGGSMDMFNGEEVGSFVRLNPDGTLDRTFATGITPGHPTLVMVESIAPAHDGSGDVYIGGHVPQMRVHENGVRDASYMPAVDLFTDVICPAQDGTGEVLVAGFSPTDGRLRFLRLNRDGAVVSTFHEPSLGPEGASIVLAMVPVLDGTRDLYVGGTFTTYNGVPVNHIARIHADGSLASVVH